MHKSTGDKLGIPDGWVIYRLGDVVTSVLPLGRHTYTSPIFRVRVFYHFTKFRCLTRSGVSDIV